MAMCTETDAARLVEKSAQGNFEAFGEIYSIYLDRIYRYVLYQVGEKMIAEDLTQEIFLKAWRAIGSYQGHEKGFSAWLFRIAHNHVIDNFRKKRPILLSVMEDEGLEIPADYGNPLQELETNLAQEEALELISCLPLQQRQIIALKFIEGLDNQDIEQVTGKSQGAIRVMQMRALVNLRKKLGEGSEK